MQSRWWPGARAGLIGLVALCAAAACTSPDAITLSMDPDPALPVADRDWVVDDGSPVDTATEDGGEDALGETATVPRFRVGSASELPSDADVSGVPTPTFAPQSMSAPIIITPTPMITALPIIVVDPNNPASNGVLPNTGTNGDPNSNDSPSVSDEAGDGGSRPDSDADDNARARALAAVVNKVRNGVVAISATECGATRNGTGFVVDAHHILTAAHVVGVADSISITANEASGQAWLVNNDVELDLALLWVAEPMSGWEFSFAPTVKLGEEAAFLEYSATGAFTATRSSVETIDTNDPFENPVIKFGAVAKSGDSGAPVVDVDGDVIGILNRSRPYLPTVDHALYAATAKRFVAASVGLDPQQPTADGCADPAPPGFAGVRLGADHRQGETVKGFFDAYISSINGGDAQYSWNLLSPKFQDSIGGYAEFADGHKSSTIGNFTVNSIVDTDTGLAVEATFVSTQDTADGPNGWPCATWSMRYDLIAPGDGELIAGSGDYLIDSARNLADSPAACQ